MVLRNPAFGGTSNSPRRGKITRLITKERGAGYEADNKDKKGGGNKGELDSQVEVHTFKCV